MISTQEVREKYHKYSHNYDLAVKLYGLLGLQIQTYRLHAVDLLNLRKGDLVIELGCGTGLNFPFILDKIGPEGRLIGVDIAQGMLDEAQRKVDLSNWENIELINSDIVSFDLPEKVNGILSMGVFGYLSEPETVIKRAAHALQPDGTLVIFDLKQPKRWPTWLFKLFIWLGSPFGVTTDYFRLKPWESIGQFFKKTTFEEKYGGLIYFVTGQ